QASGRRDRHAQHSAHLGTESAAASPHPLCDSDGRSVATAHPLATLALSFFSPQKGPETCLPRQVSRRTQAPVPPSATTLPRSCVMAGRPETVRPSSPRPVSPRLGGPRQTLHG